MNITATSSFSSWLGRQEFPRVYLSIKISLENLLRNLLLISDFHAISLVSLFGFHGKTSLGLGFCVTNPNVMGFDGP
jgi:hypothetical protein